MSPQAKGRVERTAGTFQDRLITELRLAGATTLEQAKAVLTGKPLITLDSPANGNLVELGLVVAKAGSDGMLLSRSTKRLTDRISIMKGDETFFLLFPMQVSRV